MQEIRFPGTGINDDAALKFQKNYHDKAMALLKKLNPEKADIYEYSGVWNHRYRHKLQFSYSQRHTKQVTKWSYFSFT